MTDGEDGLGVLAAVAVALLVVAFGAAVGYAGTAALPTDEETVPNRIEAGTFTLTEPATETGGSTTRAGTSAPETPTTGTATTSVTETPTGNSTTTTNTTTTTSGTTTTNTTTTTSGTTTTNTTTTTSTTRA